jgi:hypothetical protein
VRPADDLQQVPGVPRGAGGDGEHRVVAGALALVAHLPRGHAHRKRAE